MTLGCNNVSTGRLVLETEGTYNVDTLPEELQVLHDFDPMLARIPQSIRIRTLLGSVLGVQDTQFCEHALSHKSQHANHR